MEKEIVLKQNVVPLFNCLICKKLFDHPTNITECNHIFCRRCIEDKFTVENLKACPVCNVDLGVDPLEFHNSPRLSSACRLVLSLNKVAANLKLDLRSSKQLISSRSHARSSSSPNAMTTELRLGKISRIWLREETVRSTQKLHELVDWWVQTTPVAERKSGMVGRSAAGFVMKLHYSGSYFTSLNNSAGHLSSSNH
ncbi:unnamed protein product [Brassica oleracea]